MTSVQVLTGQRTLYYINVRRINNDNALHSLYQYNNSSTAWEILRIKAAYFFIYSIGISI